MYSWHDRPVRPLVVLVLVSGCLLGGSSGPRVAPTEFDPPPPGAAGTLSGDPVRDELREILTPCQRSMNRVLEEGRVRRSRYRRIATAVAVIAAQAAYYGANAQPGGNSASGAIWEPSRCAGPTADRPECNSFGAAAPAWGGQLGGDDDQLDEYIEIPTEAVQDAIVAVDDLLWTTPDSADWSDEQWDRWSETRRELKRACRALHREEED